MRKRPTPEEVGFGTAHPGYEWRMSEDTGWRCDPAAVDGKTCRWIVAPINQTCGLPAGAVLYRGDNRIPYAYCGAHMYGRWVERGKVYQYVLRDERTRAVIGHTFRGDD